VPKGPLRSTLRSEKVDTSEGVRLKSTVSSRLGAVDDDEQHLASASELSSDTETDGLQLLSAMAASGWLILGFLPSSCTIASWSCFIRKGPR
jgi:hypothetical protein